MREVRRGPDRYVSERNGIRTLHSFSHGAHYDPENIAFGPVMTVNEEQVGPGVGYAAHRHSDVEILTWVLEGALEHEDTTGQRGVVRPGTVQHLSAGHGVEHAERNASAEQPLRFVQMVLRSEHDGEPRYADTDVPDAAGPLAPTLAVRAPATLHVLRPSGAAVELPAADRVLVHVTRGRLLLGGEALDAGDQVRAVGERLTLSGEGEALVWSIET